VIHHEPGGSVTRQWTMRIDGKDLQTVTSTWPARQSPH